MNIEKKLSISGHLRSLQNFFIYLIVFICFGILYFKYQNINTLYILGIILLVLSLPTVIIYLDYFFIDRNKVLSMDFDKKEIVIRDNKQGICKINNQNLKSIIFTGYFSEKKGGYFKIPWLDFYYYQVDLTDNETIYLTSLLIEKDEFPFKINRKRFIFFPFIEYFDYEKLITINK